MLSEKRRELVTSNAPAALRQVLNTPDADVPSQRCSRREQLDEVGIAAPFIDRIGRIPRARQANDVGHGHAAALAGIRTIASHLNRRSITSWVVTCGATPSVVAQPTAIGEAAAVDQLHHMLGHWCAKQIADLAGDAPFRTDQWQRQPSAASDRLHRRDRSRGDNVQRALRSLLGCGDESQRRVGIEHDHERGIGQAG